MNDVADLPALLAASRILIIDDNQAIHQDFRKIFGLHQERSTPSTAELALLGGGGSERSGAPEFQVDSAYQGKEGLALVQLALEQQNPYAVAFVDVRMPPGWDGVETTARIWQQDPDIQVVICTAFSDYSWSEMLAKLGRSDRLVILKKPFDTIEVVQLASALTEKWRLARQSRSAMADLERRVAERTRELVQTAEELRASEARFRSLSTLSSDWFWEQDAEHRFVEFSGGDNIKGWGPDQRKAIGMRRWELPSIVPLDGDWTGHKAALAAHMPFRDFEYRRYLEDGSLQYVAASGEPLFDADGRFTGYRGVATEITQRKETEVRIRHLNRVYAVLSGINALIVRVSDREELFREACRIAVELGGFGMAWIGIIDRARMELLPVASAGTTQDYRELVNQRFSLLEDAPHGNTLGARSIREKSAIFSNDVRKDPRVVFKDEHAARGSRSMVILPLQVSGEVAGLITLYAGEADFFHEAEMKLLTELAGDIAFAMDHIAKAKKLARMTRMNAVLSGINGAIVRIRDRQELFEEACRIAVDTGGLPFVWLGVVDEAEMRLRLAASAGGDADLLNSIGDRLSLRDDAPLGYGLAARSVREKCPLTMNDAVAEAYPKYRSSFAERGIRSVAAFPLLIAGRAVGTFALHSTEPGFFDADEMKLLNEVAANIAFALEHLEKEEKVRRLTRVYAVLSGINTLIVRVSNREELFREACRIAVADGGFLVAWLGIVDRSVMKIVPAASAGDNRGLIGAINGLTARGNGFELSDNIAARAINTRKAIVSNDSQNDPGIAFRDIHTRSGIRSMAVLPLLAADQAQGALALYSAEAGFFDEEEMKLLTELAGDIGFAIDHIEKAEKLARITRMNAMLSGINTAIVRIRGRQELFDEACRIALETGGMSLAWVGVADASGNQLQLVASAGRDDGFLQTIRDRLALPDASPEAQGLSTRAFRERRVVLVNDVAADPVIGRRKAFADRGIKAVAIFPLYIAGRAVGTFALHSEQAGFFDNDELRLLNEVAANIAFALEHIEKEEKVRRLTRVYAVLSGINALIVRARNRDELFSESCRIAVDAGAFAKVWIGIIDPASRQLRMVAAHGGDPLFFQALESELAKKFLAGLGLSARAAATLQPVVSNDAAGDPEVLLKGDVVAGGVRSIAILPLLVSGAALGVLALNSDTPGFFDAAEMTLLAELARDIAFAIDHIDKNEKLDRMTRVNAVLSGINALIVRVRDRDELFREACLIAVEKGQFKMAWIGVVNRTAMKIEPVASAGSKADYLAYIKDNFSLVDESPAGLTMTARAVLAKKAIFSNDTLNDPGIKFKKEHAEAGTRSLASLPLLVADEAVGVLCLYTEEANFFDDGEMTLLLELVSNISFAIDHIGKQERLDYFAYYDALTGLANRTLFLERVALHMRSAVAGGHKLALFFLDLERFRNINDSLGRPAGDALLQQVSEWLVQNVGDRNLLARLGADQFGIVLPEVAQDGDVARLLDKRVRAFVDHSFRLNDTELRLAAKVGVAVFPNDGTDAETLLRNAETALKKAKAGGERFVLYTQKMTEAVAGKLTLESQLRRALDNEEFVLHYQPKVSLESGKLTGAEALIRWNDPHTGLVPPGKFIPILEETGLIYDVGRWALRKAIADYLRWRAAGLPAVRIAVNVSPLQLRNRGFVTEIKDVVGIDAEASAGLEIEITESVIMEDVKNSIASLQAIREMGVTIAIDDFGTGFSSLAYLAKLPVDTLKIDRSFVMDMTVGPDGLALVTTIINLAHSLKLKVVAEGVETEEQSRLLRLLHCDEMQGFLFSKPVPGDIFATKFLLEAAVHA